MDIQEINIDDYKYENSKIMTSYQSKKLLLAMVEKINEIIRYLHDKES